MNHRVVVRIQTLLSGQVNPVWPHMVQLCVMRDAERGQVSWLSDLHLMSGCMTHKWAVTADVPADGRTPICLETKSTQNVQQDFTLSYLQPVRSHLSRSCGLVVKWGILQTNACWKYHFFKPLQGIVQNAISKKQKKSNLLQFHSVVKYTG